MRIALVVPAVLAILIASVIGFQKYRSHNELDQWQETVFSQAEIGDPVAVPKFKLDGGELVSETALTRTYRHGRFEYVVSGKELIGKERLDGR